MDPLTMGLLGSSALSAGGSLFGGMIGASGQAQTNAQQIAANQQMQQFSQNFTAQQGDISRDYNTVAARDQRDWSNQQRELAQGFNAQQALVGREFARDEAQKNRDYQTEMANTAWQRGIKDMKAAGINPILAASLGGASAPSGSMATSSMAQSHAGAGATASSSPGSGSASGTGALGNPGESMARGISSAAQVGRQLLDLKQISQQIDESKARAGQANSQENLNKAAEKYQESNTTLNTVLQDKARQDTATSAAQSRAADAAAASNYADAGYKAAQTVIAGHDAVTAKERARNAVQYGPGPWGDRAASATRIFNTGLTNTYDLWKQRNTEGPPVSNPSSGSDFWGTSPLIRERAARNRAIYGGN